MPGSPPPADRPPRRYRPDIDGLRALAVSGVILFHYGVAPVGGGFAGVDVFFVISGFLIAAILRGDGRSRISLLDFAERRVRRLVPGLLVVLAASSFACMRLLPNDLKLIGLGLMNAVTFTSNFFFDSLAEDYFQAGTLGVQTALHTWSLAVEAQFYIVLPALWLAAGRRRHRRTILLSLVAACSFVLSLWGVAHRPSVAFYLLPARFWEFMTGAAMTSPLMSRLRPDHRGAMVATGLVLILVCFVLFSGATPFPGLAALLPCVGAALVIGGGAEPNAVSRVLGARPLALIGRLSYALYLWHWPILIFASYGRPLPLPLAERLVLLALTGLLSFLSHRYVERPLIERRWLARRKPFLIACGATMLGVAGLGLVVNLAGQNRIGFSRLPDAVLTLANGQFDTVETRCPVGAQARPECRFGAAGVSPRFVVWGNSFARMWMPGLDRAAARHGAAGVALFLIKCPPIIETAFPTAPGCDDFNRSALGFIDDHPDLTTVLLGGNWPAWPAELPALRRTIAALRLRGRKVVVIRSPPQIPYAVPRILALAALWQTPPPVVEKAAARTADAPTTAVLAEIATAQPFMSIDPFTWFCDERTCQVERDGHPLYSDDVHVSGYGAALSSALFDPLFTTSAP